MQNENSLVGATGGDETGGGDDVNPVSAATEAGSGTTAPGSATRAAPPGQRHQGSATVLLPGLNKLMTQRQRWTPIWGTIPPHWILILLTGGKANQTHFPRLATLARRYLCVPVPSEWVFSAVGLTANSRHVAISK